MGVSKKVIQKALGIIWLLDGFLQLQHQMFSSAFAYQVIKPAEVGQPTFVTGPMNFGVHIFLLSPVIFNSLFALTQLAIGALILWYKTLKLGLILSVLWGLIVWIFGEGYGGILSGHTLLLMGAPGAVLIYVFLSLAALPKTNKKATDNSQMAYWIVFVWAIIWIGGGVYQLLPGQNSTTDLSAMIVGSADGAPGWLNSLDTNGAKFIEDLSSNKSSNKTPSQLANDMNMTSTQMLHMTSNAHTPDTNSGYWFILLLAVMDFSIGLAVLLGGVYRKFAVTLGIVFAIIFWVIGESLGGYYTGLATDPNSGPLLILLGLAILGCKDLDKKLIKLAKNINIRLVGKTVTNIRY